MSTPVLQAVGVEKRYPGGVVALRGVDLEVSPGETLVLVGESGCGKSTLLRLFNRLHEPTRGELFFEGRPLGELDPVALRRQIGYVQQDGGLLPHWSVARNVELVPELLGWPRERRRRRRDELLELVGLDPDRYASRYPGELSGGQRQRVAVARALAADPHLVLLDEPFGALDAITRHDLQGEFDRLRRRLGQTTVLVTHDLDEAFRLADRIAILRDGKILRLEVPERLAEPSGDPSADDYVTRLLESARGVA
jgi:osmoprotectant transport system ATP-binding protein